MFWLNSIAKCVAKNNQKPHYTASWTPLPRRLSMILDNHFKLTLVARRFISNNLQASRKDLKFSNTSTCLLAFRGNGPANEHQNSQHRICSKNM